MNKERITRLADTIEPLTGVDYWDEWGHRGTPIKRDGPYKDAFTMEVISYDCGSPASIVGWANHLSGIEPGPRDTDNPFHNPHVEVMQTWLGITNAQAGELWKPIYNHLNTEAGVGNDDDGYISPKMAADVLRRLAETGEVRWPGGYRVQ